MCREKISIKLVWIELRANNDTTTKPGSNSAQRQTTEKQKTPAWNSLSHLKVAQNDNKTTKSGSNISKLQSNSNNMIKPGSN